ncbi:hypothetical protein G4B88_008072 [Cannabis sativa]|uniref:RING-type E3 ubiquitin transferase n=1 Tax=Cannabis sativa TaxID=3483 RepID=A0A7J6I7Y4_CANSA|nr:hypothetical protein G4B88_008072 [Cannabis sativa]
MNWVDADCNFAIDVYTTAIGYHDIPDNDGEAQDEYGVDDAPINFVPATKESIESLENGDIKDGCIVCSICFENVDDNFKSTKLPCTHIYHKDFIFKWLLTSKYYPLCRFQIESALGNNSLLLLHLFATYTSPQNGEGSSSTNSPDPLKLMGNIICPRRSFMDNGSIEAKEYLEELLEDVLPPSFFNISDKIIDYVKEMWVDTNHNFAVNVYINAIGFQSITDSDHSETEDEDDADHDTINFEPAIEQSIQSLEKAEIKEDQILCSIYFENVQDGFKSKKLPCTHIYHDDCIIKWLLTSKYCPLCRFEIGMGMEKINL